MRVAIIQPNFLPWRGYFDFIDDVDLFIYHDDLQYTKGDWRNRNKIKTSAGSAWISVPVHYKHTDQRIMDTTIDYSQDWAVKMRNQITANYLHSPFFKLYSSLLFDLLDSKFNSISALNIALNSTILGLLDIKTKIILSSELDAVGTKTDRIIDILQKVNASIYLSGPSAQCYLEEGKLTAAGITLEYKSYKYLEYPQQFGAFDPNLSIIDLIFNCGKESRKYIKSQK